MLFGKRMTQMIRDSYVNRSTLFMELYQGVYTPGICEQSGVLKDSMIKVYLGYRNIYEILKSLKEKNELIRLHLVDTQAWSVECLGSTCAVCASAGYTRCFGRSSDCLCASSLQNLSVTQDFSPFSLSQWNDIASPLFDVWDWRVLKEVLMVFHWPELFSPVLSPTVLCLFLFFLSMRRYSGAGVFGLPGFKSFSPSVWLSTSFIKKIKIIII